MRINLKKTFKNNLSEFSMDEDFGTFFVKEKGNNDSESSLSILQKKTKRNEINCNEDDDGKGKKQKIFNIEKLENDKNFFIERIVS